MDAQTQQRINALSSQVRQSQSRIADLDRSLALLRAMRAKTDEALWLYGKASSDFESDRQQSFQSINQLRQLSYIKLAQGYAESFTSVLKGAKSSQASDALYQIGTSLRNEQDRLDQEIRAKEAEINSLQGKIYLLGQQINASRWGG